MNKYYLDNRIIDQIKELPKEEKIKELAAIIILIESEFVINYDNFNIIEMKRYLNEVMGK